jgi:hypothetical protein
MMSIWPFSPWCSQVSVLVYLLAFAEAQQHFERAVELRPRVKDDVSATAPPDVGAPSECSALRARMQVTSELARYRTCAGPSLSLARTATRLPKAALGRAQ